MSGPTTRPWGHYDDRHVHARDVKLLSETEKALLVHLPRMVDAEWFPRAHVALLQENGKPAWLRVAAWLARERGLVRRLDDAHADLSKLPVMELDKRGVYAPTLPPLADVELWIVQTALSPLDEGITWMLTRSEMAEAAQALAEAAQTLLSETRAAAEAEADLREERTEVARLKAELDLARQRLVAEQDAHRLVRTRLGELARQRGVNRDAVVRAPTSAAVLFPARPDLDMVALPGGVSATRDQDGAITVRGAAGVFTIPVTELEQDPYPAARIQGAALTAAGIARPSAVSAAVRRGATLVTAELAAETAAPAADVPAPEPDDAASRRFSQLELDEEWTPGPGQNKK